MTGPQAGRLLITGGRIVDPASGRDGIADLLVEDGMVSAVGADLPADGAERIEARGRWVIPGLVDLHVHLVGGATERLGHAMLARAGVTTALELGGPVTPALRLAARHGAGLTIAFLDRLEADHLRGTRERSAFIDAFARARADGAIGFKLHADDPLTPSGIDQAIGAAGETGSWVAIHCGSTETRSDLTGLREALAIADGRPLHIAHVNSYCRGALDEPRAEADEALSLLQASPAAFAESYLSPWNGNWGGCRNGVPERSRVRDWLVAGGFPPTESGLAEAILAGYAGVPLAKGGRASYATGEPALEVWRSKKTRTPIGFRLNPFDSRARLATAADGSGFVVPAFATDGGLLPRNVTLEAGLALVELGALTPSDLVLKSSRAGALALGLPAKGRLGEGADADLAIVDPERRRVVTTIAGGRVVVRSGRVVGTGTRALTAPEGTAAVVAAGCRQVPYRPEASGLRSGRFRVSGAVRLS